MAAAFHGMTTAGPFPALVTSRLLLRELTAADADDLLAIHADATHMRWFGSDPLTGRDAALELIRLFASWRQAENPGTRWALQRRTAPGLIGTCGLFRWNRRWRTCTIGYELAAGAQGHGFMQEALTAAIDWGWQSMDLNRIEAQIHPRNARSIHTVRQLGFECEGRLRQAGFWGGQFHDLLQFSLLREDWQTLGLS